MVEEEEEGSDGRQHPNHPSPSGMVEVDILSSSSLQPPQRLPVGDPLGVDCDRGRGAGHPRMQKVGGGGGGSNCHPGLRGGVGEGGGNPRMHTVWGGGEGEEGACAGNHLALCALLTLTILVFTNTGGENASCG